jgi:DNA-binding IclR family transcriptional regulator
MMFRTLSYHIDSLELQAEAKPYLDALQKQLRLTVYLGVLDGPFVSVIEKVATDRSDEVFTQVGRRLPTHSSSMGKCLLACLSSDELEGVLCDTRLVAYTSRTIIDKREFVEHLHKVRRQGWALDDEETELGHCCIASPVFDYRGDAVAVVSVSGTKAELPDEELGDIAAHVVRTAKMISKRIGYTGY